MGARDIEPPKAAPLKPTAGSYELL